MGWVGEAPRGNMQLCLLCMATASTLYIMSCQIVRY